LRKSVVGKMMLNIKEIRFFGKIGFLNAVIVKEIRFFGKIGFLTMFKFLLTTTDFEKKGLNRFAP